MTDTLDLITAQAMVLDAMTNFDAMDIDTKIQLRIFVEALKARLITYDAAEELLKIQSDLTKAEVNRKRQEHRKSVIPDWCKANLKVDMIVKVKAASSYKYRRIESVGYDSFVGRHCHPYKRRNKETGERYIKWDDGGYITDHLFTNVQSVYEPVDDNDINMTPIMKLIED